MAEPAVVSIMKLQGDPDELMEKMRSVESVAASKAAEYGGISSTTVKTDDGVMIINMWSDEEGRHKMAADPEVQAALGGIGMTPSFKAYQVLAHRTPGH